MKYKDNVIAYLLLNCLLITSAYANKSLGEFTNSIEMEFVLIPNGTFFMGQGKLRHKVFVDKPFYIGKYEVTQRQWNAIMGKTPFERMAKDMWMHQHPMEKYQPGVEYQDLAPDEMPNPEKPVVFVTWKEAQSFATALSKKEGKKYQLPSEAEWEYAARAGTTTRFFFGNDPKNIGQYAWYAKNSDKQTHPVGQLKPNPWGLYDIYGNVAEWCRNKPTKHAYDKDDPCAQETLGSRCIPPSDVHFAKGGAWDLTDWLFKVTDHDEPRYLNSTTGFRLILHTE